MEQASPQREDIDKAWEYYEHADNLYASRINFFLVAESMVVVAYVTLQGHEELLRMFIAILGLVYTYIWFDVNLRLANRMTFLDQNYLAHDMVYNQYTKSVSKGIPSRFFLTYGLPIPTGIFWSLLLGHATQMWWLSIVLILLWVLYGLRNRYRRYGALPTR